MKKIYMSTGQATVTEVSQDEFLVWIDSEYGEAAITLTRFEMLKLAEAISRID